MKLYVVITNMLLEVVLTVSTTGVWKKFKSACCKAGAQLEEGAMGSGLHLSLWVASTGV